MKRSLDRNNRLGHAFVDTNVCQGSPEARWAVCDGTVELPDPGDVLLSEQGQALFEDWIKACEAAGQIVEFPPELANEMERVAAKIVDPLPRSRRSIV